MLTSNRNASSKMLHNLVYKYRACAKMGFFLFFVSSLRYCTQKRFGFGTHFYQKLCWVTIFKHILLPTIDKGVGLQVLTTLVTARPLYSPHHFLDTPCAHGTDFFAVKFR